MDLVRTKGTDCNIDLNIQYPENPTVGLQRTGETGVGWRLGKSPGNRDPRVLETLWLVQVPGADLFVSTISYVTGAE